MSDKKETNLVTLKNVIFVYSSVAHPQKQLNKDNKPPLSDDPLELHSWEIKILITEDRFKKLKKKFRANDGKGSVAKNFPNVKELTPEECADQYGIDEPDEDMVLIKFAQACLTGKKGARKPARPIRMIGIKKFKTKEGLLYQDSKGEEITSTTSIGNGSLGHFQFSPVESDFGLYLYPAAVCVTDLVEYVAGGGDEDDDSFGVEEGEFEESDEDDLGNNDDGLDDVFEDDL